MSYDFFFAQRKSTLTRFGDLFRQQEAENGADQRDESEDDFTGHWGWFATVYRLSKSTILKITGDNAVTDVNFIFTLNFLAYEHDINSIEERKRKQQEMMTRRIR